MWAQQSVRLQQSFEQRAKASARERRHEIEEELSALGAQLAVAQGRMDEVEQQGCSEHISMSSAGLSDGDLEVVCGLIGSADFRALDNMQLLREHALSTPLPWGPDYLAKLATHPVDRVVEPGVPGWGKVVVHGRDFFKDCGLSLETDGAPGKVYKVLY